MLEIPLIGVKVWRLLGFLRTDVINVIEKGTFCTSFEPSLTFIRLSVRAVRELENAERKTKTLYFTYVCGRPMQPIVIIFGVARDLADEINRAKFYIDQYKGFGHTES